MTPAYESARAEVLTEIAAAPIRAELDAEKEIILSLPFGCRFGANTYKKSGHLRLIMRQLFVPEIAREAGIATRLTSGLIHTATRLQPERFSGHIDSHVTPKILKNLLGEVAVTYYDMRDGQETKLPLTAAQASESIRRVNEINEEEGLGVIIDLSAITASDFEEPTGLDLILQQHGNNKLSS